VPQMIDGPQAALAGLPGDLADAPDWSDEALRRAGLPVQTVTVTSVGGGLASFALVDQLRIRGLPAADVAVVTDLATPYQAFRRYARNSQLCDTDRIRSDSAARIDNPWGFPSYAMEEAVDELRPGPLLRSLTEPVLATYFTPRAEQVYAGIDREARRIDWPAMVRPGTAAAVRRRAGGGFFVAWLPTGSPGLRVLRSTVVHLGIGHSGMDFSEAALDYRQRTGDRVRVVHAYEPHEHVYRTVTDLGGGTVLVQGAGITSSQVIQRLADDRRQHGLSTRIVQVTRSRPEPEVAHTGRRPRRDGIATQPFSAPRSAFGGQLHQRLERSRGDDRRALDELIARPSTADRRRWRRTLARARSEGWYTHVTGELTSVEPSSVDTGQVLIATCSPDRHPGDAPAPNDTVLGVDFVIECTGTANRWEHHPLVTDALRLADGETGTDGALRVDPSFALAGTRDPATGGALYGSGAELDRGPLGPRDSFWGMTFAAHRMADDLAAHGLCRSLGPLRSVAAWLRWVRERPA